MRITINRKALARGIQGILLLSALSIIFFSIFFDSVSVIGATNITNTTVIARVNITNTHPNITSVIVDDDTKAPANTIDLVANSVQVVTCNATIFDTNGAGDINPNSSNATLFLWSLGSDGQTDNNFRYRNESCGECITMTATTVNCGCRFAVQYYANYSSEWLCNFSIHDMGGTGNTVNLSDSESSLNVTVTRLLAINTSSLLDYGNLSVTQTTGTPVPFNVSNGGNTNLNLTLRGYGGTDEDSGINNTMACEFGNISIGNQRYMPGIDYSGVDFDSMRNLSNQTSKGFTNLTIMQRENDTQHDDDVNTTYWRLRIPTGVGGICNGTIIFGAIQAD